MPPTRCTVPAGSRAALTAAVLALCAPAACAGEEIPARQWLGVNVRFTGAPGEDRELLDWDIDEIRAAGFGRVRAPLDWEAVEREKGTYRFDGPDALLAALSGRGVTAVFALASDHRLYAGESESRAAFERFAAAAAGRYRGRGVEWEVAAGAGSAAVRAALRAADPGAKVIEPGPHAVSEGVTGVTGVSGEVDPARLARALIAGLEASARPLWIEWSGPAAEAGVAWRDSGLVSPSCKPRPAYLAAATVAYFASRAPAPSLRLAPGMHVADLGGAHAVWVEGEPRRPGFRFAPGVDRARVAGVLGEIDEREVSGGVLTLNAAAGPQYLQGVVAAGGGDGRPIAVFDVRVEPQADRIIGRVFKSGGVRETGTLAFEIGRGDARIEVSQDLTLEAARPEHVVVPVAWVADRPIRVQARLFGGGIPLAADTACGYAALHAFGVEWPRTEAEAANFKATLEGDEAVRGEVLLVAAMTRELGGKPEKALRVEYRFGKGRKLAGAQPAPAGAALPGEPRALSLWVKGDGLGNTLLARFRDATGEVFESSGGAVDWMDWRHVTLSLGAAWARSRGGDGKVDYPIAWEHLVAVESRGDQCAGSIEIASPLLVHRME